MPMTVLHLFSEIAVNYGPLNTVLLLLSISLLPTTFAAEITRVVAVGRDGNNLALKFSPNVTIANVVSILPSCWCFPFPDEIARVNHSVVQAEFDAPCVPKNNDTGKAFFSGFNPLPANTKTLTTFTIQVTNTDPIFFYCSQGRHCQQGLVGAINPNSTQFLEAFRKAAINAPDNLSPGETPSRQTISPDPGNTGTPTNPNAAGQATSSNNNSNTNGSVTNVGAILGGVLGGVVFMILALSGTVFYVARRRRRKQFRENTETTPQQMSQGGGSSGFPFDFFRGSSGGGGIGTTKGAVISRPMVDDGNLGPFGGRL